MSDHDSPTGPKLRQSTMALTLNRSGSMGISYPPLPGSEMSEDGEEDEPLGDRAIVQKLQGLSIAHPATVQSEDEAYPATVKSISQVKKKPNKQTINKPNKSPTKITNPGREETEADEAIYHDIVSIPNDALKIASMEKIQLIAYKTTKEDVSPYDILEISHKRPMNESEEEFKATVKTAKTTLMRIVHPNKTSHHGADQVTVEIVNAAEFLANKNFRKHFDEGKLKYEVKENLEKFVDSDITVSSGIVHLENRFAKNANGEEYPDSPVKEEDHNIPRIPKPSNKIDGFFNNATYLIKRYFNNESVTGEIQKMNELISAENQKRGIPEDAYQIDTTVLNAVKKLIISAEQRLRMKRYKEAESLSNTAITVFEMECKDERHQWPTSWVDVVKSLQRPIKTMDNEEASKGFKPNTYVHAAPRAPGISRENTSRYRYTPFDADGDLYMENTQDYTHLSTDQDIPMQDTSHYTNRDIHIQDTSHHTRNVTSRSPKVRFPPKLTPMSQKPPRRSIRGHHPPELTAMGQSSQDVVQPGYTATGHKIMGYFPWNTTNYEKGKKVARGYTFIIWIDGANPIALVSASQAGKEAKAAYLESKSPKPYNIEDNRFPIAARYDRVLGFAYSQNGTARESIPRNSVVLIGYDDPELPPSLMTWKKFKEMCSSAKEEVLQFLDSNRLEIPFLKLDLGAGESRQTIVTKLLREQGYLRPFQSKDLKALVVQSRSAGTKGYNDHAEDDRVMSQQRHKLRPYRENKLSALGAHVWNAPPGDRKEMKDYNPNDLRIGQSYRSNQWNVPDVSDSYRENRINKVSRYYDEDVYDISTESE